MIEACPCCAYISLDYSLSLQARIVDRRRTVMGSGSGGERERERASWTLPRATRIDVDLFHQLSRKRSKLEKNFNDQNRSALCKDYGGIRRSSIEAHPVFPKLYREDEIPNVIIKCFNTIHNITIWFLECNVGYNIIIESCH